jgi:hypothetical protein
MRTVPPNRVEQKEQSKGVRTLNHTLMAMHNPPHPGEFIIQVYLDPNNLSGRELAGKLGVAASTLNRILTCPHCS